MIGFVFCAGLGTRLKPITDTMPKALLPLAGKPLLQWQVEKLRDAGIRDIIVNVHHFADQIIDAVKANDGWGCNIMISDERDELLDTGGGLKKAIISDQRPTTNDQSPDGVPVKRGNHRRKGHQSPMASEPILACNVDILSNIDIKALVEEYTMGTRESGNLGLLVVSERETQRYLLFDEDLILRGWTNVKTGEVRPSSFHHSIIPSLNKLAFSGMQILSPEALELLTHMPQSKFSLIDFYISLCEKKRTPYTIHHTPLKAYVPKDYKMMDVGKIEQLSDAEYFANMLFNIKSEKK